MSGPVRSILHDIRWVAGALLIIMGILLIGNNLFEKSVGGSLFLPVLGALLLIWGMIDRSNGMLIPGGILAGIGVGSLLNSVPYAGLEEQVKEGIFLVSFGAGWILIAILSAVFTRQPQWWALIPGGIIAGIGAAKIIGGQAEVVLNWIGRFWPLGLVIFGIWLLFKRKSI